MYRAIGNFRLRPGKADEPISDNKITPDELLDVIQDDGDDWVKVRVSISGDDPVEGYALKAWLKLDNDRKIDKLEFIQECFFAAWDFKANAPYLVAVAQISSGIQNIPSESSAAFGPFQILPEVWAKNMSDPKIKAFEIHRYEPMRQPQVAAKIAGEAMVGLATILPDNRNPKPPELYMAQLFGLEPAKKILEDLNRVLPIDQALLKAYAGEAKAQEVVDKIIASNKSRLAPGGQPLLVDTLLINIGEALSKGLAETVTPDIAHALEDPLSSKVAIAMAVSGETRYWIVNLTGEETGGQVLIRQVGGKNPEVLAFDTVLLPVTSNVVPADIAVQLNKSNETGVQQGPAGQQLPAGANHGPPMLAAARAANRKLDTSTVPNTNGGTLACAWAVNEIARRAVGKPIGGGLSTVGLFDALQRGHQSASEAQLVDRI